jgi:hypothetical protein
MQDTSEVTLYSKKQKHWIFTSSFTRLCAQCGLYDFLRDGSIADYAKKQGRQGYPNPAQHI